MSDDLKSKKLRKRMEEKEKKKTVMRERKEEQDKQNKWSINAMEDQGIFKTVIGIDRLLSVEIRMYVSLSLQNPSSLSLRFLGTIRSFPGRDTECGLPSTLTWNLT